MCEFSTNPLDYMGRLGRSEIWRFALTHPDMDHLDGFDAVCSKLSVSNYWDTGVRKEKPDFSDPSRFREEDWDRYEKVRDGGENTRVIAVEDGSQFKYANQDDVGGGGDGLHILSPTNQLVKVANQGGDINDASLVTLYRSGAGRVLIPGDAHDRTWEHVLSSHSSDVAQCDVLIAPHHGRKSGRNYDFLNVVRPRLTLFGCAPSDDLAYDAWNYRGLPIITNNQAGNITLNITSGSIDVYVENERYAATIRGDASVKNALGEYFVWSLPKV